MKDSQTKVALNWVREEIESTLEQAQEAINAYAEDESDDSQIRFTSNCMHQIRGTLQILEFNGAALLAEEMEMLATAIGENSVQSKADAYEVFLSSILRFKSYLARYGEDKPDLPIILMPIINDMRACRKQELIGAGSLINIDIGSVVAKPSPEPVDLVGDIHIEVKKYRTEYEQGLLGFVKGDAVDEHLSIMAASVKKMWGLGERVPYSSLWWVGFVFVDYLSKNESEIHISFKTICSKLDQCFKDIATQETHPEKANALLGNLLFYVAQFDDSHEGVKSVKQHYNLESVIEALGDYEQESESLHGPDTDSIKVVLNVIKDDLDDIKESLDLYVRTNSQEREPLEALLPNMQKISDTMSILSLSRSRRLINEQMTAVKDLLDSPLEERNKGLVSVVESVLKLEDYINSVMQMDSNQLSQESGESNQEDSLQVINARYQLIQESRTNLQKVKDSITDYLEEGHRIARLENVPSLLNEVEGSLQFSKLDTLKDVVHKVRTFVSQYLIDKQVVLSEEEVVNLADSISCVDYYLEGLLSSGLHGLPMILKRSIDSIDELHTHYGSLQEEVPTLDDSLVLPEMEMIEAIEANEPEEEPIDDGLIDDEVREIFIEEVEEVLGELNEMMPRWKANQADEEALSTIRRNFHTLKGSGRMVEAHEIGELGWAVENMLNRLIDHSIEFSPAIVVTIEQVMELLPAMVNEFANGKKSVFPQELADRADRIRKGEIITDLDAGVAAEEQDFVQVQEQQEQKQQEKEQELQEKEQQEQELLEIFRQEAEEHITNLEMFANQRVQGITQSHISDNLLRSLHTLKGVAHVSNIESLKNVIVPVEGYFQELKSREWLAESTDMDLIGHTKGLLKHIIEHPEDTAVIEEHEKQILTELAQLETRFDEVEAQEDEQGRDPAMLGELFNMASDVLNDFKAIRLSEQPEEQRRDKISHLMAATDRLNAILLEADIPEISTVTSSLGDALQRNMASENLDVSIDEVLKNTSEVLEGQFDSLAANLSIDEAPDLVRQIDSWKPIAVTPLTLELVDDVVEQAAAEKAAAEQAAAEKAAAEKAAAEKAAAEKAAAEKAAAEKAAAEKAAAEQAAAEKAAAEQAAAEQAAAEKAAAEQAAAEKAAAEKAAAEQAAAEKAAAEKAAAEQAAAEQAAAEQAAAEKAAAEKAAAEQAAAEKAAAEQAAAEKAAAEKAAAEQAAAEKAAAEKAAAEQAAAEKAAAEQAAAEKAAAEKAAAEQAAAEQAAAEKAAAEQAAAEQAAAEQAAAEQAAAEQAAAEKAAAEKAAAEQAAAEKAAEPVSAEVIDDDIDEEIFEIFTEEAEEIFSNDQELLERWAVSPSDLKIVAELQRNLHTLKGSARMANITEIGDLSHELEELYTALADKLFEPSSDAVKLAQHAEDKLQAMFAARQSGSVLPQETDLINQIINYVEQAKSSPGSTVASDEPVEPLWDQELAEIFMAEANELLANYDEAIIAWSKDLHNVEALKPATRSLHTLKGGARLSTLSSIANLSEKTEAVVELLTREPRVGQTRWKDLLVKTHEQLSSMVMEVRQGVLPDEASMLMTQLDNDEKTIKSQLAQLARRQDVSTDEQVDVNVISLIERKERRDTEEKDTAARDVIRIPSNTLDNIVNLSGETSILRSRIEQQVADLNFNLEEVSSTVSRLKEQLRNLEIETEAQVLYRQEISGIDFDDFDPLEMDRYTRQQELTRSLLEAASDLTSLQESLQTKIGDTEASLLQQARVNTELQDRLMRTRMVPFSSIESRLNRMVRQISTELGKKVKLNLTSEGEMDRTVIERMVAPLDHMLRNAIDHGVESAGVRKAAGKPEVGQIDLSLVRRGNEVFIQLKDDGAGISKQKVKAKAVAQGLLNESYNPSDRELFRLILQAGFSTADKVTQVSGRGVGMDVVNSEILQLGGSLSVQSEEGRGTTMTVRLPFTLASNQSLMVKVKGESYAVPLSNIATVVRVKADEIRDIYQTEGKKLKYLGQEYDLRYLGQILDRNSQIIAPTEEMVPVLIVEGEDRPIAIQVDELLGSREVVVKSVGRQLSTVPGISGASILGDGSVVLILDMQTMVDRFHEWDHFDSSQIEEVATVEDEIPTVMVVDDSITVRKVTSRLLQRHQYKVHTAKDGVDAINQLNDIVPDVMLLDIEMPRMDGFELATLIRRDSRLKHIPIIMITSRTGEKHRQRAEEIGVNDYLGKPYNEDKLLSAIEDMLVETGKIF